MDNYEPSQEDMTTRALAYELKNPLINIARRAELADPAALEDIQLMAEQSLSLIDSFLLTAQTEYGQVALDLEPASVGSILYDAAALMRHYSKRNNITLILDDKTRETVMTHRPAISAVLNVFGNIIMSIKKPDRHNEVVLSGYRTRDGSTGVGIFSDISFSQKDLDNALALQGKAHMPLANLSSSAHVSLIIADNLCRALGGGLKVKRIGGRSGLTTDMPISVQLAFI